ncbi:MAG: damage-inducible protein DinB [Flavobacteriales bacterium]|nr:damage-inducible protein DinB [Flavobacteriales bacterium]
MKNFFEELFEYNHDTNIKLINALNEVSPKLNEKIVKLFSHILNAHHIWVSRIENISPEYSVFELQPVLEFRNINTRNHLKTLEILDQRDLMESIAYQNTKGISFESSVQDILFHLINHSNYHRAQIATEMVNLDLKPILSDYIFYKRTKM